MLDTTKQAMAAIIKADPTLNQGDRARLIALMDKPAPAAPARILKRKEVAALVGRSVRTLDYWRKAGLLKPVKLKGCSRSLGYRSDDVQRLIEGEPA